MTIRDKQTGQTFDGPDGTPFDTAKYELVSANEGMGTPDAPLPYQGAPDLPLQPGLGDVSDKTAGALARIAVPAAGAMFGPAGLLRALVPNALAGAGGAALGNVVEGKPINPDEAAMGAAGNVAAGVASRPLGALLGVAGAKLGLTPKITGSLDLSKLAPVAQQAADAQGLVGPRVSAAGEKIAELLGNSGGSLPIHAPGLQPSVELLRKGIPFKQAGGKEMYGALRDAATQQAPNYDKLLQQYRSMHALTDLPSMKEILGAGVAGGGGMAAGGLPGLLAVLLPRLYNSARFAPAAPGIQSGMNAVPSLLDAFHQ